MNQAFFTLSGGWVVFLLVFSVIMAIIEKETQMKVALVLGLCASIPRGVALFALSLTVSWPPVVIAGFMFGCVIAAIPAFGCE